jgi:hypothetical protein
MCCVKSNHIIKIMTFCTLVCMALEYVLYPSHIRISLCIPIKVFICLFAILKELQQLQNILLSFLRKENGLPKITIVSHTYCYNIILRIVTQSVYTLKKYTVCMQMAYLFFTSLSANNQLSLPPCNSNITFICA